MAFVASPILTGPLAALAISATLGGVLTTCGSKKKVDKNGKQGKDKKTSEQTSTDKEKTTETKKSDDLKKTISGNSKKNGAVKSTVDKQKSKKEGEKCKQCKYKCSCECNMTEVKVKVLLFVEPLCAPLKLNWQKKEVEEMKTAAAQSEKKSLKSASKVKEIKNEPAVSPAGAPAVAPAEKKNKAPATTPLNSPAPQKAPAKAAVVQAAPVTPAKAVTAPPPKKRRPSKGKTFKRSLKSGLPPPGNTGEEAIDEGPVADPQMLKAAKKCPPNMPPVDSSEAGPGAVPLPSATPEFKKDPALQAASDAIVPRKKPLNEKEKKIKGGAQRGSHDYPTMEDIVSDWDSRADPESKGKAKKSKKGQKGKPSGQPVTEPKSGDQTPLHSCKDK